MTWTILWRMTRWRTSRCIRSLESTIILISKVGIIGKLKQEKPIIGREHKDEDAHLIKKGDM